MTCARCRKKMEREASRCPNCGQRNPSRSGTFQVSSVLISAGGAERVYRSVDEVPAGLRTRLLKSTNSPNSATILIADRRGRKEIARAMRKLPGGSHRRLIRSVLSGDATPAASWLTPRLRRSVMALVALCCAAFLLFAFTYSWTK
jgi:hypothetical protein